jgi:AcrR family transcriptional regulator
MRTSGPAERAGEQARVDGRTERWRQHRIDRRREFVEAALRALAKHGPDVNIAQIAAEAGVAKPRLYRHFEDKADLLGAVQEYISGLLWQRLSKALDPTDAPSHLVRTALEAFISVVDEHPQAFRLMLHPSAAMSTSTTERMLEDGMKIGDVLSALIAGQLRTLGADAEGAEPLGHALAGAVGAATHWWLEHRTISKEALIDHLSTVILGALEAILRTSGVSIDMDQPISPAS